MEDFFIGVSGATEVCECPRVLHREGWGLGKGKDVDEVRSAMRSFFTTVGEGFTVYLMVNPTARKLEGVRASYPHLTTYEYTAFLQDIQNYNDY